MQPRFAQEWTSYEAEVLPLDASPVQRLETKRAFYAGAMAMTALLVVGLESAGVDGPEPTPGEVAKFQLLVEELQAYAAQIGRRP